METYKSIPAHPVRAPTSTTEPAAASLGAAQRRAVQTSLARRAYDQRMHRFFLLPAVAILLLAGCAGVSPTPTPTPTSFQLALEHCKVSATDGAVLGDHNKTLTLQGFGVNYPTHSLVQDQEFCVLKALKITDAVTQMMESTRALDGTQKGAWGAINASWTYHPDDGLRVILTTK